MKRNNDDELTYRRIESVVIGVVIASFALLAFVSLTRLFR